MTLSPSTQPRRGVLLVNLGSPDSPAVPDVRRYLREFLMDDRVLDVPWFLRKFIVECTILPSRPKETARAYQKIWTPEGSPLVAISRRAQKLLQAKLEIPVELAMRYGNPSLESGIRHLIEAGEMPPDEILFMPLYPHYAMSSYETVVEHAKKLLRKLNPAIRLRILKPFYREPPYIEALVASAREYLDAGFDHLLFSYHGIPERHVKKSDPTGAHCLARENCCARDSAAHATCYRHQVFETTKAFVAKGGVPEGKYSNSFQSRLGKDPWLKPYTDFEYVRLAESGVKKLLVICPAFVADCLETLEEIGMRGREDFLKAGGKEFVFIPCMNAHPLWIEALRQWINRPSADIWTE
ncbi:ferrochelatase [Candidatus Sumerlaeota bacterium]|nr:ferrochelatase [Candidatus Sumerlaeota bacterium]MBI3734905.1 ferrochelatase [Candidatus Sumerlaeota bacterium]